LIRSFRAAFFTGVRLGLALATVRFVAFPRADLDTLLALPRVAEFPLGSFPRFCTFDPFLRLAMIEPPVLVGAPQSIDAGSPSPGNLSNELSPDFSLSGPAWALFFLGRIGASLFATEGWDGGKVCRITSMPGFDSPHDVVQEHGTYGGQGKAVEFPILPAALLFVQAATPGFTRGKWQRVHAGTETEFSVVRHRPSAMRGIGFIC
jgi:hypothetical protein